MTGESGPGEKVRDGRRTGEKLAAELDLAGAGESLAQERLARIAWSKLAEPSDLAAHDQVATEGAVEALRSVLAGRGPDRHRSRLSRVDPSQDLDLIHRLGGRVLIPADDEWPEAMSDLGTAAPFCLWVRGPLHLGRASEQAAAIVGARASTPYGDRVATELGHGCAKLGITVVSGAAYGIDGAAHRGALAADGATVAVLAGGVDRFYPRGHDQLVRRIAAVGAVVSEIAPGCAPSRVRFLERNRLIAALAQVTVVVEAAQRSGATGTALRAEKLSRQIAAVPGPITSAMSYGCHRLLRDGAVCVTSADEVAELVGPIGTHLPEEPAMPKARHDGLDPRDLRVFEALPIRRGAPLPSLVTTAGLDEQTLTAALGRLELLNLAERDGPGWRRAPA